MISNPEQHVYGMVYEIGGNAASSIQFHVTDSSQNFLRGALYFYAMPNADSLAPVISFVRSDIDHLLKTFKWKN
jgi:gliding motility-associated lipoprotein GldD